MSEKNNVYTTLDSYIAGYLVLKGFKPALISQDNGHKVVFAFQDTDSLQQSIHDYQNGAKIEALRLAMAVKSLKSQIFSMRRGKEEVYGSKHSRYR